jgi:hypothetical protein
LHRHAFLRRILPELHHFDADPVGIGDPALPIVVAAKLRLFIQLVASVFDLPRNL